MAERTRILEYTPRNTVMHRMNGAAKLAAVAGASIAAMITFDTRLLAAIAALAMLCFVLARVRYRDLKIVLWLLLVFLILNNVFIFLFAPEYGTEIYGTRNEIAKIGGWTTLTWEQLFYQLNVSLKYFAVVPIALVFIVTTRPSEFASSLNRIGVPAKVATSVSLALRFVPDLQRDLRTIMNAQQARGIDVSRQVSLMTRIRRISGILMPLLLASLARIEVVATALELRGFERGPKRTWYAARPFTPSDWVIVVVSALLIVAAVALLFVNGGRFFNPFA